MILDMLGRILHLIYICMIYCWYNVISLTVALTGIIMFIVATVMKRRRLLTDKETGLEENDGDHAKLMRIFRRVFVCIFIILLWYDYAILRL